MIWILLTWIIPQNIYNQCSANVGQPCPNIQYLGRNPDQSICLYSKYQCAHLQHFYYTEG